MGSYPMPSPPSPIVTRSNISVVSAVPQPLPTPPTVGVGVERDVVEEDLVELGLAGDLAQAAHGHAGGVHRHDEHREARCAWGRRGPSAPAAARRRRTGRSSSRPSDRVRRHDAVLVLARAVSAPPRGPSPRRARRRAGTRPRRRAASARGSAPSARSEPWAMIVGPSIPTPIASRMPGDFRAGDLLAADDLLDRAEPLAAVLLWPASRRRARPRRACPARRGGRR